MTTQQFIDSLDGWPELEATIFLDGHPPSIGVFSLDSKRCARGTFLPNDQNIAHTYPLSSGVLKLSGKTVSLAATRIGLCASLNPIHYHFDFEVSS